MPQGEHRARPEGARGSGRERPAGVRGDRRARQGRPRGLTRTLQEVFLEQAESCENSGSRLYADVCRQLASEPRVESLVREVRWDVPLRVLGALHFLALSEGIEPWRALPEVLEAHGERLERFVSEQAVQTNEVLRCFGLLPGFLTIAREAARPLDLVELGPSAGLNLVWDRYGYRYPSGGWGRRDAPLVLDGEARPGPPAALLEQGVEVEGRLGIDLNPVDVTSEEGARLLQAFVWADQHERVERVRRAIDVVREAPPQLVQGDYVELLPAALERRRDDTLTVVFQTASTAYLGRESVLRLHEILAEAGERGPLAWLSTRTHDEDDEHRYDSYALELRIWPGGEPRVVARMGFHGEWLEWRA